MSRSLAAVPAIGEIEDLLAEIVALATVGTIDPITKVRNPGIPEHWRAADIAGKARRGGNGGSPISEHDPVGEYVTDIGRDEVYGTLAEATRSIRLALGQLRDARSRLEGRVRTEKRRVEMKDAQSFDHDGANRVADDYGPPMRRGQVTGDSDLGRYDRIRERHARSIGG